MHGRTLLLLLPLVVLGCSEARLGSNVLWSDDFESGTLAAWEENEQGGQSTWTEGSSVEVSSEVAHGGGRSLRLHANTDDTDGGGAAAFRLFSAPEPAYYSAWFYVPTDTRDVSTWIIMQFDSIDPDNAEEPDKVWAGLSLKLRRLPNGELALYAFHADRAYLQEPLAVPRANVQVQRWFHVEARLVFSTQNDGELAVWLDGAPVYRLTGRATAKGSQLQFSVTNAARHLDPVAADLFVDDVVVSRDRVTPDGEL